MHVKGLNWWVISVMRLHAPQVVFRTRFNLSSLVSAHSNGCGPDLNMNNSMRICNKDLLITEDQFKNNWQKLFLKLSARFLSR
jgi:hypothetical protein